MEVGYEWDVFISYRRKDPVLGWMNRDFYPKLEYSLSNSLPVEHELKIFIDQEEIPVGSIWPDRLKSALLRSRCMVAILTPDYFRSSWCCSEFNSMMERRRQLGSDGVVYPIRFFDGEHFPEIARSIQSRDFTKWSYPDEVFSRHPEYLAFEDAVKLAAGDIAKMILNAPAWQAGWPVVDALARPAAVSLPRIR